MTSTDLVSRLLPVLGRSLDVGFNVFDVMHHGTHEKQLSNVFRWLLEIGGTHRFEALGQRVFVELVDSNRAGEPPLPLGPYSVHQEVNTSAVGEGADIADIVLESDTATIVVENYETSDGHGHGYDRYLAFSRHRAKSGTVVLLCATEDRALLKEGWEHATVVTYEQFLDHLIVALDRDPAYARENDGQYAFIRQMHLKYARRRGRMSDTDLLEFVTGMCTTGEARRYQQQNQLVAAEQFADELAQRARESYGEGREVLRRVKERLRRHSSAVLIGQLNSSLGAGFVQKVSAGYNGIYQWTVNFDTAEGPSPFSEARLQIKFGPSAWFANEQDPKWKRSVPSKIADYSKLFVTRASTHELRQSSVSMREVLGGLDPNDTRLHDEIVQLLQQT